MLTTLGARSVFSIGESILQTKEIVAAAQAAGEKTVAITDTMSVTGMIELAQAAAKHDLATLIGCRLLITTDATWRKTKDTKKPPPSYYITWYALSEAGMQGLYRLLSFANSSHRFYQHAKLTLFDVLTVLRTLTADDVAITSGDAYSAIATRDASDIMRALRDALDARSVFTMLCPVDTPYWDAQNARAIAVANELGLSSIVARPSLYKEGDADAAEVMGAISRGDKLADFWHRSPVARDLHPLDRPALIAEVNGAIRRVRDRYGEAAGEAFKGAVITTAKLVRRNTFKWEKQPVSLPKMATDELAALMGEVRKGWVERFSRKVFGHQPSKEELETVYKPRLAYEIGVLKRLEFAGYFLLVQDVVRFAKSSDILVGPGRGSVGGSLVAYLMGITDCDPIRFDLLFERFINPERIDLPDADLDFMSERRGEVVKYLVDKYGAERVAGISNFGKLGASSSIRDVGRVAGLSEFDYACSKFVPKEHGQPVGLGDAAQQVAEIDRFRKTFPEAWGIMEKLEGAIRNMSQHAAGVVVAGCDLSERAVVERRTGDAVLNWDKRVVEEQGLVKMDILGLNTLDLIALTLKYIRKRHSAKVDLLRIPLDDTEVIANFAAGRTTGIFQMESGGMRRLLKNLGKDGAMNFEDVTAATALYRPGPMESGMMDSYWKRKAGEELVEYDHPLLKPILEVTYGVIVYQEQVMQISRAIAGYSGAGADKLRKIMGKKLPEEMEKERDKFVAGCVATIGCAETWAQNLFDKIAGFAGYGFNRSHSIEYSLITYQCMFLKTRYPVEFFAAALSLMGEDKLPGLMKDAERFGITVDMPDINHSTDQFEIVTDTRLVIPFNRVKGISTNTAAAIIAARKDGPFASIADLTARVERRKCNVRHVGLLDRVGAFAAIEPGQPAARHPDRIRDQVELLPGLITDHVPVHRSLTVAKDKLLKVAILDLWARYSAENEDDGIHVKPTIGKTARFMVVSDAPSSAEEEEGRMAYGRSFESVLKSLDEVSLSRADAYWTAILKRPKAGKQISADELGRYSPYLKEEISLLKPPVIVLLGSQAVRQFIPGFRGKASEAAGTVVYDAALDANLIIGFSPGEIYYDGSKQALLTAVFEKAAELVE